MLYSELCKLDGIIILIKIIIIRIMVESIFKFFSDKNILSTPLLMCALIPIYSHEFKDVRQ